MGDTSVFENLKFIRECKTTKDKFLFLQYMGLYNLIEEKELKLINERAKYVNKRELITFLIAPSISYAIFKQNKVYSKKLRIASITIINIPLCLFYFFIKRDYRDFIDYTTVKYSERIETFYQYKQSPLVINPTFLDEKMSNPEMKLLQMQMLSLQQMQNN